MPKLLPRTICRQWHPNALQLVIGLLSGGCLTGNADKLDDFIGSQMNERHIVGLSLAIINEGRIVKAHGYGFTEQSGQTPVTASTLFQAGSISKPVAALAALNLVEQGRLSLTDDVNSKLKAWKVPDVPVVEGLFMAPTLRPDGTVLANEGYDPSTRLLLVNLPAMPEMPERPTREDAEEGLKQLAGLLAKLVAT